MELKQNNNSPSFEEVAILEKKTGGKIGKYEMWTVKGTSSVFQSIIKPKNKEDIIDYMVLENSFMSQNGEYIGNYNKAKWYAKNNLKVYEPYAHGVAIILNENSDIEGYYGYTHRGGQSFKIGDRLFEETYIPKKEDYTDEQWESYVNEYNKVLQDAKEEGNEWWIKDIENDNVSRVIPYKMRGSKTCNTLEDCIKAAINMSKHLS